MQRLIKTTILATTFLIFAAILASAQTCPTICVIIPETVTIHQIERQIPEPAAETAIIHHFLDYDFHVVDQKQIGAIRYSSVVSNAIAGQQLAIQELSDRFAADILVLGRASAEETEARGELKFQSARANINLRAIEAATGRIVAADASHAGGIDFTLDAAAEKALQRAGDKIFCKLAEAMAHQLPHDCIDVDRLDALCFPGPKVGTMPFENDRPDILATMVQTALSELGYSTVHLMVADYIVTGAVTDYRELLTPVLEIPVLDLLWRTGASWMTLDVQVINLDTGKVTAYEVTANVAGVEIFGIRFGFSSGDLARKASQLIAAQFAMLY